LIKWVSSCELLNDAFSPWS